MSMPFLGFSAFNGGASLGSVGLGVSPKEVNVPGMGIVGMQKGGETPPDDLAAKQCVDPVLPTAPRPLIPISPSLIFSVHTCASLSA